MTRERLSKVLGPALAVLAIWACAGEAPKYIDAAKNPDQGAPAPAPAPTAPADQGPWPDAPAPPEVDTWPSPGADAYAPAPFGCSSDDDCFGRSCCATPWGANLCADSCM